MRKRMRRKQNKKELAAGLVLAGAVAVFALWNLFTPVTEYSAAESRALAQRPKLTWESVMSGDYKEKYERFLSDQFAGREFWRGLKVAITRIGGEREENGVILGNEEQLLDGIESPEQESLAETIEKLNAFSENYQDIPMHMMLVPDAATVLTDAHPYLADVADQNRMIAQVKRELGEKIDWIDVSKVLNDHSKERIYYQTDARWTTLGAYYAFGVAAKQLEIDSDSGYATYPVSTTFNGILASKSGYCLDVKEQIDIYVPQKGDNDVVVSYVDEQRKTTSLYDSSKLNESNQYELFLGGDTSVVDIKTATVSNRRLLLVKDSFANCFVPFLTPYFREIVVVDPHYYSGSLKSIMETYHVTDVLFLYSGNGFFQDNSLSGVLECE